MEGSKYVNMELNVHRNRKAYKGRGEGAEWVWRWGKREIIYLSLHCHRQNDSSLTWAAMRAILMFHNCEGQSHKTVSTNHNF